MKVEGLKRMEQNLQKLGTKVAPYYYEKALIKFLIRVEANSAKKTPVDTGNLKWSGLGNLKILKADTLGATGTITNIAAYASYVHERTDLKHKPGKGAKFLENAVKEESAKMTEVVGQSLKTELFAKAKI